MANSRQRRRNRRRGQREALSESTFGSPRVDREKGVIHDAKVLGRVSRNGKTYSDPALRDAAGHYEGMVVNIDHPPRSDRKRERSVNDGFGVLKDVTVKQDGVYADLHYLTSHQSAPSIAERAEKFPHTFGLSQNGEGIVRRDGDSVIVESVDHVRSVDIVSSPATNDSLFESEGDYEDEPVKKRKTTVGAIVESLPEKARKPWREWLVEIEDEELVVDGEAMAAEEMPVEVAADASPEDQMREALKAMLLSVFEDDSLDLEATKAKIVELLDREADVVPGAGEGEGAPKEDAEPAVESYAPRRKRRGDPRVALLEEQLRELRQDRDRARVETDCTALLESMSREVNTLRIKTLALLPDVKERKALVESWPKLRKDERRRPERSAPLVESDDDEYGDYPKDHDSFLQTITA